MQLIDSTSPYGKLSDNQKVAVKIVRPNIGKSLIRILTSFVADFMEGLIRISKSWIQESAKTMQRSVQMEMDLRP